LKECPKCRTQNTGSAHYCKHCSQLLGSGLQCPKCGKHNSLTARFCKGCGSSLAISLPETSQRVGPGAQASPQSATPPILTALTGKLPPKTKIGDRYEIVSLIGMGGMGAVYLVMDSRLGNKKCALKEMSSSRIHDPVERQMAVEAFKQEAQILCNLSHPGLPRVTDFFSQENKHFLVMDYIQGQSLLELLDVREEPFTVSQVLDWGIQLCDVLEYLHRQSPPIIYRDLKPGNIIVSTNQKRVRLIDFGTARIHKSSQEKDTVAIGTPGYAPPEQYGKGQTDARSDLFALAATLHQLLTLQDPGIILFQFPPVRSLNPSVSMDLETAISKAVEKDINQRLKSIAELKDILRDQKEKSKPLPPPPKVATSAVPSFVGKSIPRSSVVHKPITPPSSSSTPNLLPKQNIAAYWPRFWSYLIDNLILIAGGFLIAVPFLFSSSNDGLGITVLLMAIWAIAYYTYFHSRTGQTPGKKANGLKVVYKDGSMLTWLQALWRSVLFLIFHGIFIYIGWILYIIPFMDQDNRALHDIITGTLVIEV
jgi:serine/threonine protein kinase